MKKEKDNSTRTAFFLNLSFTVLEVIGGIISGSVAILADSLHDFADSLSLGVGWYFEEKSKRGSNDKYTYGYARFSLLGAMVNAIALLLGSIFIVYKSVTRIIDPQMPDVYWMLGISILGILLNGIGVWKLKSGKSMNKQVMTIHLLEDSLGWLAVFLASVVLLFVNIPVLDPILAIAINVTVLIFVLQKLVAAVKIMMQRVPEDFNIAEFRQKILCIDKVKEVSHFHVWTLTEKKLVVTVHIDAEGIKSLSEAEKMKQNVEMLFSDLDTDHITINIKSS